MGGAVFKSKSSNKKREYLKLTPFFLTFKPEELEECAKYFALKQVKQGHFVKDYAFIVVVDGKLSISTLVPRQQGAARSSAHSAEAHVREHLCVKKNGDFFSKASQEVNVENQSKIPRAFDFTNVKALTDSTLLILNKRRKKDYLQNNSKQAALLHDVLSIDFGSLLEPVPFLSGVPRHKLTMLAEMFAFESFSKDDVVVKEGEESGKFYVVLSGKLSVVAAAKNLSSQSSSLNPGTENADGKVELAEIENGSYFGEMSLLCNMPRTASVVARGKCLLASLDADQFHTFEKIEHSVKDAIHLHAKERMMNRLYCFQIPFFAGIPMDKLIKLSHTSNLVLPSAGDTIITEGNKAECVYIVVHGELDVTKKSKGVEPIATIVDGSYFAEISFVTNRPLSATVVAKTDCVLLAISMDGFREFFRETPELLVEFEMRVVGKHGIELRHVLHHKLGLQLFKQHLASEYSDESILFWEDLNNLKELESNDLQQQIEAATKKMITKYIAEGSPTQINVSDLQRSSLLESFEVKGAAAGAELFEEVEKEIFQLMKRDNFQRFTDTPLFDQLVQSVCIYSPEELVVMNDEEKRRRSLLMVSEIPSTASLGKGIQT